MTDRHQLQAMLTRAHVEYLEYPHDGGIEVRIEGGTGNPSNQGYFGCFTLWRFSATGSLVGMGVWGYDHEAQES
jgi:hypothetical protein